MFKDVAINNNVKVACFPKVLVLVQLKKIKPQ